MRLAARFAAPFLAIVAVALFAAALHELFDRYRTVFLWSPANATVLDKRIGFRHDGEGKLRFFVRARLRYATPAGEHTCDGDSSFDSLDFPAVRFRMDRYEPGMVIRAFYNPVEPAVVRFGAEYSIEYLHRPVYFGAAGLLCATGAAVLAAVRKRRKVCTVCKTELKNHYLHCTFCGASASRPLHLIRNERRVAS